MLLKINFDRLQNTVLFLKHPICISSCFDKMKCKLLYADFFEDILSTILNVMCEFFNWICITNAVCVINAELREIVQCVIHAINSMVQNVKHHGQNGIDVKKLKVKRKSMELLAAI
ncbi:hypothetical protein T10_1679 [Trichinella papuae]|uniref:Uncharacterized protein n=1 Tax=Trichinella papuae TaxID=268474 RepID=A0A0V1MR97_9BILA|nr:hypothetical protein T10_1679 [Trichinella papuae]